MTRGGLALGGVAGTASALKYDVASYLVVGPIPRDETAYAFFDRHRGSEIYLAHQVIDVRPRFGHVARLHRRHFLDGLAAKFAFQQRNHTLDLVRAIAADIVRAPRRRA